MAPEVFNCRKELARDQPVFVKWLEDVVRASMIDPISTVRSAARDGLAAASKRDGRELLAGTCIDDQLIIKFRTAEGNIAHWYVGDLPSKYKTWPIARVYPFRKEGNKFREY